MVCIDLMSVTARLLDSWITQSHRMTSDFDELLNGSNEMLTVFDCSRWLRSTEPPACGTNLPACWTVTSDSIAGRLAVMLRAAELVLLKSRLPPKSTTFEHLAAEGVVDRYLPTLAAELPTTRLVSFRADGSLIVSRAEDPA